MNSLLSTSHPRWLTDLSIKENWAPFELVPPIGQLISESGAEAFAAKYQDVNELLSCVEKDTSPLPVNADRELYYGEDHQGYWVSGLRDLQAVRAKAEAYGILWGPRTRYFELGCASGRVVRHAQSAGLDVTCSDINHRHVDWVRAFLPPNLCVFANTVLPSLPIEDRSMDLVTAFSVFTHIDDFEAAWLAEIRRILRPGGIAYLSIQTEYTWKNFKPWLKTQLLPVVDIVKDYSITEEFLAGDLPRPKTVFWWMVGREIYNSNVFHTSEYVRREWGRYFEIVEIVPHGHVFQDVVVARRRD